MMDCATARERMLEADPDELRGEDDSEVAAHLRDCAACRARAAAILAAEAEMASALDALAAPRSGARVVPLRRKASVVRRAAAGLAPRPAPAGGPVAGPAR